MERTFDELDDKLLARLRRSSLFPGQIGGDSSGARGERGWVGVVAGLEIFVDNHGGRVKSVVGEGALVLAVAVLGVERARDSLRLGFLHGRKVWRRPEDGATAGDSRGGGEGVGGSGGGVVGRGRALGGVRHQSDQQDMAD